MLREHAVADLEGLKASLDRDYRVLAYLLKHATGSSTAEDLVEKRMLKVHYHLMRTWFGFTRNLAPSAACRALDEMAAVVAHFANTMGAQTAAA